MPRYRLGRWDGTSTLFGLGGNGYVNQLERVLEILADSGIDVEEVEDLREPIQIAFPKVQEDFWGELTWPKGHIKEGEPIRLRDYQYDVINRFLENPQALQEVATGAGKTIITATLSKICEQYGRTVTIVPNKSLVEQTEEDFRNCGLDVEYTMAIEKNLVKHTQFALGKVLTFLTRKVKIKSTRY
jgi:superfamily II DNA or RNA helicase